jgi:hypothetical protein
MGILHLREKGEQRTSKRRDKNSRALAKNVKNLQCCPHPSASKARLQSRTLVHADIPSRSQAARKEIDDLETELQKLTKRLISTQISITLPSTLCPVFAYSGYTAPKDGLTAMYIRVDENGYGYKTCTLVGVQHKHVIIDMQDKHAEK